MSLNRSLLAAAIASVLLAASGPLLAQDEEVGEIRVVGRQEFLETQFNAQRTSSGADSALLISRVPGGGANHNVRRIGSRTDGGA